MANIFWCTVELLFTAFLYAQQATPISATIHQTSGSPQKGLAGNANINNAFQSQPSNTSKLFWFDGGLGLSTVTKNPWAYFTAGLGASLMVTEHNFISARFLRSERITIFSGAAPPNEYNADFGLLYGFIWKDNLKYMSVSAGLATTFGRDAAKEFTTLGIPIEGRLIGIKSSSWGGGVIAFANVNSQQSFGGVLFCLEIGKLR